MGVGRDRRRRPPAVCLFPHISSRTALGPPGPRLHPRFARCSKRAGAGRPARSMAPPSSQDGCSASQNAPVSCRDGCQSAASGNTRDSGRPRLAGLLGIASTFPFWSRDRLRKCLHLPAAPPQRFERTAGACRRSQPPAAAARRRRKGRSRWAHRALTFLSVTHPVRCCGAVHVRMGLDPACPLMNNQFCNVTMR